MFYNELTRHYFEHPARAGDLPGGPAVFRGEAGTRAQGTWVRFAMRVAAARVVEARFVAFGCPHVIAVAAYVAERAAGTALNVALPEPVAALRERFAAPVEKLGRLLIVEDAWLATLRAAAAP